MPINLSKTLILHTLIDNEYKSSWMNLWKFNKSILDKNGYHSRLLCEKPTIIPQKPFNIMHRNEMFLHISEEDIKNYDYFIYTELDCFFMWPAHQWQHYLNHIDNRKSFMINDSTSTANWGLCMIPLCFFSKSFLKKIIEVHKIEFEIISNIGIEEYSKLFPLLGALDESFWAYIIKKHNLNEIERIDSVLYDTQKHYIWYGEIIEGRIFNDVWGPKKEYGYPLSNIAFAHIMSSENKIPKIKKVFDINIHHFEKLPPFSAL